MIELIIPGNKTRLKILKTIYENPGINITGLIKTTKVSPNFLIKFVNDLCNYNIISEERIGGKKKTHIRNLKANLDNEISRNIFSFIEKEKNLAFFKKYPKLKTYFFQLDELLTDTCILVYGSYARFNATKDSDIDVIIIGKQDKEKIKRIKEIFVTIDVSLKLETSKSFMKNVKKPLYQNILRDHVVTIGINNYLKILNNTITL